MIELVVVLAIISILASIVVPEMKSMIQDAREKQLMDTLAKMRTVLENFYGDHGRYPFFIQNTDATGPLKFGTAYASITRGLSEGSSPNDAIPLIKLSGNPFNELVKGALRPNNDQIYGWINRSDKYLRKPAVDPTYEVSTWTFIPHAFFYQPGNGSPTFDPTQHIVAIDVWGPQNKPDGALTIYDHCTNAGGVPAVAEGGERLAIASGAFEVSWATGSLKIWRDKCANIPGYDGGTWYPLTYRDLKSTNPDYSDL